MDRYAPILGEFKLLINLINQKTEAVFQKFFFKEISFPQNSQEKPVLESLFNMNFAKFLKTVIL